MEIKITPSQLMKLAESWKEEYERYEKNPSMPIKDYFIVSWLTKEVSIIWRPEIADGKITNY